MIYTVFPKDPNEPWHDCSTRKEAEEYGDEKYGAGNYEIAATTGEVV